ncbi:MULTISPECIES: FxsA family protein [unclassified Ensifer]|uniref:FxsA family protein n=1 Tax=unclassified Ensifer TaxID=2633371 RepID=UPI000812FE73|nr:MULTISPECIES: FxsA family protein [unclassified Ensifer]OCO99607.1 membrane protein FxsA [Ensifer sp. LC14]OCP07281.1 membrane protein FxsA [Ensifer sp. LC13]OCP12660.1 membrane protein FxsA [Ensifer sp. LC11]OCP31689.1 membrane protein FxsA [Ensifer sp. LC499]
MRSLLIPLVVLGLPLAEIAGFVVVGREIGLLMTLLLVLASALVGIILLRVQGFTVIRRMQDAAQAGLDPGREVLGGALLFFAAILLVVPGFVSDVFGLLLFVPFVRDAVAAFLRKRLTIVSAASGANWQAQNDPRHARPSPRVIDLDEGEFSRTDDEDPPRTEDRHQR